MEFSSKGPDPASQPLNWKKNKIKHGLKCFKSPKMNVRINLFVQLYETPITPLGIPNPIVQRMSGGVS